MQAHGRSPEEPPLSRTFIVLAAVAALAGCHSSSSADGGGSNGPGERCTAHSDCASSLCVLPDSNTPIGFCSAPCTQQSDCTADFPGGCCIPTQQGDAVCAISQLCSHGDAGLGDPCPTRAECASGLVCLSSSDGSVTECSQTCSTTADCGGIPQECCEDLSGGGPNPELFCVLDPACVPDAGSVDAGPISPGGDDGGPFYAALLVDGKLTADTTAYEGYVAQGTDTLKAPPTSRSVELDLAWDLPVGTYGGDAGFPDGGLLAVVNTGTTQPSPGFVDLLPTRWQNLTLNFGCGPGSVFGDPGLEVQQATVQVEQYTPGRLRTPDAGPVNGHLRGTAYWRVGELDGGPDQLEVRERFDVPLAAP